MWPGNYPGRGCCWISIGSSGWRRNSSGIGLGRGCRSACLLLIGTQGRLTRTRKSTSSMGVCSLCMRMSLSMPYMGLYILSILLLLCSSRKGNLNYMSCLLQYSNCSIHKISIYLLLFNMSNKEKHKISNFIMQYFKLKY
jgi:hypothetical protein